MLVLYSVLETSACPILQKEDQVYHVRRAAVSWWSHQVQLDGCCRSSNCSKPRACPYRSRRGRSGLAASHRIAGWSCLGFQSVKPDHCLRRGHQIDGRRKLRTAGAKAGGAEFEYQKRGWSDAGARCQYQRSSRSSLKELKACNVLIEGGRRVSLKQIRVVKLNSAETWRGPVANDSF